MLANTHRDFDRRGFLWRRGIVGEEQIAALADAVEPVIADGASRSGSSRGVLGVGAVAEFACSREVLDCVEPLIGAGAFVVRGLLFDKTRGANWRVAWHQDLMIAVAERREAPGFTAWSVKRGVMHCSPPTEVLERMVTLRLHLDACGVEQGGLQLCPGSHLGGKLTPDEQALWAADHPTEPCVAEAGDALLMRPLILHTSSKATRPARRRVLHLEFAAEPLPHGLRWAGERVT